MTAVILAYIGQIGEIEWSLWVSANFVDGPAVVAAIWQIAQLIFVKSGK
jgi:hypothetical protein